MNLNFSLDKLIKTVKGFNIYQKSAACILAVALPASIALGGVTMVKYSHLGDVVTSISENLSSLISSDVISTSMEESKDVVVTLLSSSVEEDMEVQIVDDKGQLITGPEFTLTVVSQKANYNREWKVNDGFLKLTKIKGGDYTVSIAPMDGYVMPSPITISVASKVAYVAIDVSKLIVDESKIDASKEDAAFGTVTPVTPTPVKDTVEYVKSDKTEKPLDKPVYKYKPVLVKDESTGKDAIRKKDGTSSGIYPVLDADGYLTGAYTLEASTSPLRELSFFTLPLNVIAFADEEDEGEPTPSEEPVSTPTPSPSPEADPSPTPTPTPPPTPSPTPSPSPEIIPSPSPEIIPSPSPSPSPTPEKVKKDYQLFDKNGKILDSVMSRLKIEDCSVTVEIIYKGWQTIDGYKYYYDKNGKKVTGTQVIQGTTYYFDKDGKLTNQRIGIDVSKYQSKIDWNAVKKAGVEVAIIRVGYRGYGTGVLVEDPMFKTNINGAIAAGIKVGVYIFSQAVTTQEAVEEASMALELTKGYSLACPIFFDTEYSTSRKTGRADGLSKAQRTRIAQAFCQTVQSAGRRAGVYASKSWFYNQLDFSRISSYDIWVAHYTGDPTKKTDFSHKYDMWQYTGSGSVRGVPTRVDMNIVYKGY